LQALITIKKLAARPVFCPVEMAGIEPASERFDPRTSTSVVRLCVSPFARRRTENASGYPFGPESPLRRRSRQAAQHSILCCARSISGWRTGPADVASEETMAVQPCCCLGSERHRSVVCAIGTCFLYGFYEFGTSRLAIRDQPPPSKPVIPMCRYSIHDFWASGNRRAARSSGQPARHPDHQAQKQIDAVSDHRPGEVEDHVVDVGHAEGIAAVQIHRELG